MSGYGQFCAVARALEVVGERWTLLIVRELLLGAASFGDIRRGLPRIPKATLSARLRGLRAAGIVDADYRLTDTGLALAPVVRELARWAVATDSVALSEDDLDTAALTWDMQRRVDTDALPERPLVLALEFTDRPAADRRFWLHLSRGSINLCRDDTGAPVDVWLTAPTGVLTRWWLGELAWTEVLGHPEVRVHGDRTLQREMPRWFKRYLFRPENLSGPENTVHEPSG
ncbi:winged helix-turn-helix transcriptional regulator [Rhodococcus maanshanensis]|uniref:DNA-binding transcriptional regulator, HxlR family n=1 Tax=Rhodococcus maanshanensis TaxID=183556 RepID=A0A1H7SIQ2_9NOCA|nr:helix-turn-helix domain-containing protein [Rhodococcus maanshanensis]SEL72249.1 DNA-binding transcriptional regulator, HxlR family [Rhodococcus maanshanensis]